MAGEREEEVVPEAVAPDERLAVYRYYVEKDFDDRPMPSSLRRLAKLFKEYSAKRLEEYATKGYLDYNPFDLNLPSNRRFKSSYRRGKVAGVLSPAQVSAVYSIL